jgi:hypothetical protein
LEGDRDLKIVGKLSPEENEAVTQSFGYAVNSGSTELVEKHNKLMQGIAKKFNVKDWNNMEITPIGEVIDQLAEDDCCDEKISEDDVKVEE